ncbi:hypothetical protein Dda_5299 [Drechslerella dactyloides]|uniref:Zn(2)-C6 fungal-type domain-containing protein n=1 Tax=Drechslerella dactyloides TaxID=74499 RepID=A0AAD6NHE7_DREDA|nr:hypothetical protein Dda_5299 [Drechslerella dactyloides]
MHARTLIRTCAFGRAPHEGLRGTFPAGELTDWNSYRNRLAAVQSLSFGIAYRYRGGAGAPRACRIMGPGSGSVIKFPIQVQTPGGFGSAAAVSPGSSGGTPARPSPGASSSLSSSGAELDIELVDAAGTSPGGNARGKDAAAKLAHRRTHRKSRMGCGMCKTRKVKCDEAKPRCGNCMDRNEKCIYPDLSQARPHKPVTFHSRPSDISTPPEIYDDGEFDEVIPRPGPEYSSSRVIKASHATPQFALVPGRPGRPTNEARLLHHWITVTCSVVRFPNRSTSMELMREAIPQLAASHPFLQDALLACASVHLVDRTAAEPQSLMGSASEKYFARALRSFQQVLSQRDKTLEAVEAVFATSMMIALWNGMCAFHHSSKDEFFDDFVRWFHMSQGPKTVGVNYWLHLEGTRTRRLIEQRSGATVLDDELPEFLRNERLMLIASRVKDNLDTEVEDPATREVYKNTIALIEWVHAALLTPTNTISELATRVNTFPTTCPGAFVALLAKRDERAIAIAAHYLATACKVDNYSWFLAGGKMKRYIRVLCGMVQRKEWVVWPLITIGDSWTSVLLQVDGKPDEMIYSLAAQIMGQEQNEKW